MELSTRLRSTFMRMVSSPGFQRSRQRRARLRRRLRGTKPVVHYFHELSDPHSHLAVQKLDALRQRYDIGFQPHLVSKADDAYRGDFNRYPAWALHDAMQAAPGYGVRFPDNAAVPDDGAVLAAATELAPLVDGAEFAQEAVRIGERLWTGVSPANSGAANDDVFASGNQLRTDLGHYAGAMFHFDGEWYWGLDRLYHLENRLVSEGFGYGDILVPRPSFPAPSNSASHVTMEIFPSLRSPYTAISFDRAMALADRTGVQAVIRPVMPMMMRGIPAPRAKGGYIIFDTAREGRAQGTPLGSIVDPFGEPVNRAFSLYPFAAEQGRAREYVSRYLRAAWMEGIDITQDKGLRLVIEDIGLDWSEAQKHLGGPECEALLETNIQDMLNMSLWGVPSFHLTGGDDKPFYCWGQDRLWLVEQEIARRAQSSNPTGSTPHESS